MKKRPFALYGILLTILLFLTGCTEIQQKNPTIKWFSAVMNRLGVDQNVAENDSLAVFMKFLIFILVFALVFFGVNRVFNKDEKNRRVAIAISAIVSLMGILMIPNVWIIQLYKTYSMFFALALAVAPLIAGVAVYFQALDTVNPRLKHWLGFLIFFMLQSVYGGMTDWFYKIRAGDPTIKTIYDWAMLAVSLLSIFTIYFLVMVLLDWGGGSGGGGGDSSGSGLGGGSGGSSSSGSGNVLGGGPSTTSTTAPTTPSSAATSSSSSQPVLPPKVKENADNLKKALLELYNEDKTFYLKMSRSVKEVYDLFVQVRNAAANPAVTPAAMKGLAAAASAKLSAELPNLKSGFSDFVANSQKNRKTAEDLKKDLDVELKIKKVSESWFVAFNSARGKFNKSFTKIIQAQENFENAVVVLFRPLIVKSGSMTFDEAKTLLDSIVSALNAGQPLRNPGPPPSGVLDLLSPQLVLFNSLTGDLNTFVNGTDGLIKEGEALAVAVAQKFKDVEKNLNAALKKGFK